MKYNKFDLSTLIANLGDHYSPQDVDDYREQCGVCGCFVGQDQEECSCCQTPVVWLHSTLWRKQFGDPKARLQALDTVAPSTRSGEILCQRANVTGFANQGEATDWARAERRLGAQMMQDIVLYVFTTKKERGRAGMSHALNLARKKAREARVPPPSDDSSEGAASTDQVPAKGTATW